MPIPLSFLDEASIQEVSVLKANELADLSARLKKVLETQDKRKRVLTEALKTRFEERARKLLNEEGKDTGTTHFLDEDIAITANFRKKVEWDQQTLAKILEEHPEYKADIKCVLSLDERKYTNWPASLQKIFEPARSVKVGGYEFSFANDEVDHGF